MRKQQRVMDQYLEIRGAAKPGRFADPAAAMAGKIQTG